MIRIIKVGDLVKFNKPSQTLGRRELGIVLDIERQKGYGSIAKVKWLNDDSPAFLYRLADLKVISEVR